MAVWRNAWMALLLVMLGACDAGPSAVLPDGAGKAPVQPEKEKPPVWADHAKPTARASVEEASMPVVSAAPARTYPPLKIPRGARAEISDTQYGDWPVWSKNKKHSADDNAHYQFEHHGQEIGAKTYPDFLAAVHGFIHNPPKGTQTLMRKNGDTLYYDPQQNVFAVMTKKGAPRTLFRPESGADYWAEQKQIEAERAAKYSGDGE